MTRWHDQPVTAFVPDDNRSVLVVYVHRPAAITVVAAAITGHYPLADVHAVNIEHGGFALVASVQDVHADELWNDVSNTVPADMPISRQNPGYTHQDTHSKPLDE